MGAFVILSRPQTLLAPGFLSISSFTKFWLESLCNLPIAFSPVMCYTIVTEKERGNKNDLRRNVYQHNEKIRQTLRTVGKVQKILFYVSRPPQSNGKNLQQHNE